MKNFRIFTLTLTVGVLLSGCVPETQVKKEMPGKIYIPKHLEVKDDIRPGTNGKVYIPHPNAINQSSTN